MPAHDGPDDIPVTVLGGYLGAGKTTLVNHILRTTNERIVVLVNDFGSVSIDDDLIEATSDDKITLANGCICCSLVDGLASALEQVRQLDPPPDRLVIEASGVADPASIAAYAHGRGIELDAVITVVDAETVRARSKDRYVGDTVMRQLRAADLIVINKTDLVGEGALPSLRAWLSEVSGERTMVDATQGKLPLKVLLGLDPDGKRHVGPPLADGDPVDAANSMDAADSVFVPWNIVVDGSFDRGSLLAALASFPVDVMRVKGVVRTRGTRNEPDTRTVVHRVGVRLSVYDDGPWRGGPSRLAAIGLLSLTDTDGLERSIRATLAGSHG